MFKTVSRGPAEGRPERSPFFGRLWPGPRAPAARLHRARRYTCAQLMRRVFGVEVLDCPACGGCRRLLTFLTDPKPIGKILEHLGLDTEPPAIASARSPPDAELSLDC